MRPESNHRATVISTEIWWFCLVWNVPSSNTESGVKGWKRCNVRDLRLALPEVGGGGSPHLGVLILSRRSLECQDGWLLLPSDHLLAHSYCRLSLLAPLTHPLGLTDLAKTSATVTVICFTIPFPTLINQCWLLLRATAEGYHCLHLQLAIPKIHHFFSKELMIIVIKSTWPRLICLQRFFLE